jgi:hypothetical protein
VLSSHLFFEVFVLEDVGCGSYEAETHFIFAGFAIRKVLAADHYDFMQLAMIAVVNNLIDSGLAHTVSGAIFAIVGAATAMSCVLETGALKPELVSLKRRLLRAAGSRGGSRLRAGRTMGTPDIIICLLCARKVA